jgi:hypothetical protein
MSPQTLAEDLAYVRDLAEAGQRAPLLGGRFLAWWGGLTTLAYLCHYGIISGAIVAPPVSLAILWIGYAVLGVGGSHFLKATISKDKPGASSTGNQVTTLVWKSAGLLLGAYFMGAIFDVMVNNGNYIAFVRSLPLVIGIYGLALYVSGKMAGNRVLTLAGQVALVATVPAVVLAARPEAWLLGAGVAAFCVLLPGILLMRNEPSATV